MTPEERAQIIAQLQAKGQPFSEDDIQLAYEHPKAFEIAGAGKGRTSPIEEFKAGLNKDLTEQYGPTVAAQVMKLMAPQFTDARGWDENKQRQNMEGLRSVSYAQVPTAQERARQERYSAFSDWYEQHVAIPVDSSAGMDSAQNAVTSNALRGQKDAVWKRFVDYYENSPDQLWKQPDVSAVHDFIATDGRGWMGQARPDLPSYNSALQKGEMALQLNRRVLSTQMQVAAAQEKAVNAAKNRSMGYVVTLLNALSTDPDATQEQRDKLSGALDSLYTNTTLARDYQTAASMGTGGTADQFVAGLLGGDVQDAFRGSKYEGTIVVGVDTMGNPTVDLGATVSGVRLAQKDEQVRRGLEGTLAYAKTAHPYLDFSGIDIDAILAGGTKVDPAKQLQAEIKKITQAASEAGFQAAVTEAVEAAEREIPGTKAALGDINPTDILKQAGGIPSTAQNILDTMIGRAKEQAKQGQTFRDILGPVDATGKPTGDSMFGNVDPALREALGKGLPLWGQGAFGSLVKGNPLYQSAFGQDEAAGNAFINSVYGSNAEFGPTFDSTGKLISGTMKGDAKGALAEAQKRLVQQARDQGKGGDAAVLQAVYGIRQGTQPDKAVEDAIAQAQAAGDAAGEQALRSRLPGFKTRAEAMAGGFKLPAGGLTGRASLAFQASHTPEGSPEREALMEQIKRADDEEARAAVGRGPRPYRGRKK